MKVKRITIKRLTLDATAGNRRMWESNSENIIYLDIEKKLTIKPNIFADTRILSFKDECFDNIFFDPPYCWAVYSGMYAFPDLESYNKAKEKWKRAEEYCKIPPYYGMDKYSNRSALIAYIYRSLKEFHRVLKDDALLWFKWNDMVIPFSNILALFEDWKLLMKIYNVRTGGKGKTAKTFWFVFEKIKREEK